MPIEIEKVVNELKRLPVPEQEAAASYIHELATNRRERRIAVLEKTAGSLAGPAGVALEEAMSHCS